MSLSGEAICRMNCIDDVAVKRCQPNCLVVSATQMVIY